MILAYSVFSHTPREEIHSLVEQLRARLARGGHPGLTFIDSRHVALPGHSEKYMKMLFHMLLFCFLSTTRCNIDAAALKVYFDSTVAHSSFENLFGVGRGVGFPAAPVR